MRDAGIDPGMDHGRPLARPLLLPALGPGAVGVVHGEYSGQTAGMAPGMVQGNLAILPANWADDFLRFCLQNPKPCPVLAVGRPGRPDLPALGADIDIRSDVPRYRVFENGREIATPNDIRAYWRDDLVAIVLGCSHSF